MKGNELATALAPLVLRLALATIFLSHGGLKVFQGMGSRWSQTLPEGVQMAVAWAELIGGAALALGLLTRLASLGFIIIQVGAVYFVTGKQEFFFIDFPLAGGQDFYVRPGTEYNLILGASCLALILLGAGRASLDYYIWGRKTRATPPPT